MAEDYGDDVTGRLLERLWALGAEEDPEEELAEVYDRLQERLEEEPRFLPAASPGGAV